MFFKRDTSLQTVMNIIPLLGVIFYNWSIFSIIYAYWLESLGISFFNGIKILTASGSEEKSPHISKAVFYWIFSLGIHLFYLLFIVIFIGTMVSTKQEGRNFIVYLAFIEPSFRYTIIMFFITKLFELIYDYFISGEYKKTSPTMFNAFFSARTISLHVIIILGFFTFEFVGEKFGNRLGIIAFSAVFVSVKVITDLVIRNLEQKRHLN